MIVILLYLLLLVFTILSFGIVTVAFYSYFKSSFFGAPFVGNDNNVIKEALNLAEVSKSSTLFDLGSGDGRVLITAVKDFNAKKAIGYEISLLPRILTKIKLKTLGNESKRIKICNENLLNAEISKDAIVYVYLMPKLLKKLIPKFKEDIKNKNITIVSPVFKISGLKITKTRFAYHRFFRKRVEIYLYR